MQAKATRACKENSALNKWLGQTYEDSFQFKHSVEFGIRSFLFNFHFDRGLIMA